MASNSGRTFRIGSLRINFSSRGIAAKWKDKVYRLPFKQSGQSRQQSRYDESQYDQYSRQGYDDPRYDQPGYYDDPASNGADYGYDDRDYNRYEKWYNSEWAMWALLLIFPPVGIWLMWKNNRLEFMMRGVMSAASGLWFIVALILLSTSLFGGNKNDLKTSLDNFTLPPVVQTSPTPEVTPPSTTPSTVTPTPVAPPSPTPLGGGLIGDDNLPQTDTPIEDTDDDDSTDDSDSGNEEDSKRVYATENGKYYHLLSTCSNMTGAKSMTVAEAKEKGKTACPTCVLKTTTNKNKATANPNAKYYSTKNGKYFHIKKNCSGMKGATKVTLAEALKRNQTPCSTCIGKTSLVYATKNGKYYHNKKNCSGMKGATRLLATEAKARGQSACPVCIGKNNKDSDKKTTPAPGSGKYYSTTNGKYFHIKKNCSGMKGATKVTLAEALKRNQTPCSTCIGKTSLVYATKNGKYYHNKKNCSGMKGATRLLATEAKARGQSACPICIGKNKTTPTPKPEKDLDKIKVWDTVNGKYYHSKKYCSDMSGAKQVSLTTALKRKQKPCPVCNPVNTDGTKNKSTPKPTEGNTTNDNTFVYVSLSGEKYHSKKNCSGMTDAEKVSLTTALKRSYKRCTTCDAPKSKV